MRSRSCGTKTMPWSNMVAQLPAHYGHQWCWGRFDGCGGHAGEWSPEGRPSHRSLGHQQQPSTTQATECPIRQAPPYHRQVTRKADRDIVLKGRKELEKFNEDKLVKTYINEDLTTMRARLFAAGRAQQKSGRLQQVWTFNGNVKVKTLTGVVKDIRFINDINGCLTTELPVEPAAFYVPDVTWFKWTSLWHKPYCFSYTCIHMELYGCFMIVNMESMLCLLMVWCQSAFNHWRTWHGEYFRVRSFTMHIVFDLYFHLCYVCEIWSMMCLLML